MEGRSANIELDVAAIACALLFVLAWVVGITGLVSMVSNEYGARD